MDSQSLKPNTLSLLKNLFKLRFLAIFLSLGFSSSLAFPEQKEYRIVSLSPAITETLYDLELDKYIVGTTSFSNYPEAAKSLPTVGSYLQPSIEKIVRLNPTHVLVFKEGDPSIDRALKNAKLNYKVLNSRTLDDYQEMVRTIGSQFKAQKKAEDIIAKWKSQWAKLEHVPRTNEKILIQVDHMPIYIAGHDTFISRAFERCGLKNIFDNLEGYKKIQLESVLNRKPEIIIAVGMLNQASDFESIRAFWRENPITRNTRIIKGNGDILGRLSLRFPTEVIKVCSQIKPLKASE